MSSLSRFGINGTFNLRKCSTLYNEAQGEFLVDFVISALCTKQSISPTPFGDSSIIFNSSFAFILKSSSSLNFT